MFAHFLVNFLAVKLIATCNIRYLKSKSVLGIQLSRNFDTGSNPAHFLVNFLAVNLIATCNIRYLKSKAFLCIQSSRNLNTGSYFCTFFGKFSI